MRTRIFIGSSSEGIKIAEYIKEKLSDDFDCILWNDNIFKYNKSFLKTLLNATNLFDFGILIATKDDYLESRDKKFETPRDNIVFEFGLFLGRLGESRAFVVQEKGSKLPSDLLGITVPRFEIKTTPQKSESLNSEIEEIRNTIKEKIQLGELGFLPSTALAIGYFFNFIKITCESLLENPEFEVDGKTYSKFKLNVVIPNDLDADIKKRATIYFRNKELEEIKINCKSRSFPVFAMFDENDENFLNLFDMPTTLNGIDKCIDLYMQKGHIGKTTEQKLLEEMELKNFETTLRNLIKEDAFCRDIVKIVKE
jgi:hypothetical protein